MNCPKCDHQLANRQVDGVEIDACPHCGGAWFDLGELKRVLQTNDRFSLAGAGEATPILDQLSGPCPRCGGTGHMTRLTSLDHPDVVMDSCPVCYGIWLDGGEAARLADGGGLRGFLIRVFGV